MLKIEIPPVEVFDDTTNTFDTAKGYVLMLEHSLVSVSKWESKWCVPFLSKREKSVEEVLDYVKCMTLTQNVDDNAYLRLTQENFDSIKAYIDAPMTATTIKSERHKANREIITSEIIYYWMVALNIPFECQKWHLNRLLMLVNVCSIKQQPPKKMRGKSLASRNSALNAKRRAAANSSG
jgi:hypothetical protein